MELTSPLNVENGIRKIKHQSYSQFKKRHDTVAREVHWNLCNTKCLAVISGMNINHSQ